MQRLLIACLLMTACSCGKTKSSFLQATGTVQDPVAGKTIPNAWVYITSPGGQIEDSVQTDTSGHFSISATVSGASGGYFLSLYGSNTLNQVYPKPDYIAIALTPEAPYVKFSQATLPNVTLAARLLGYVMIHAGSGFREILTAEPVETKWDLTAPHADTVLKARCVPGEAFTLYATGGPTPVKDTVAAPNPGDTTVITL